LRRSTPTTICWSDGADQILGFLIPCEALLAFTVILLPTAFGKRRLCPVRFPLDLLVRRPEEVEVRYRGGDPVVREALDHGEVLYG
jgi:hypothetical protein